MLHLLIFEDRPPCHPLQIWDLVWLAGNLMGFNVQTGYQVTF